MGNTKRTVMALGERYHVYNRGNNREILFHDDEDYQYFIKLFLENASMFVDVYTFALLDNHFHFFIRIKLEEEVVVPKGKMYEPNFISGCFRNLFSDYAKYFNQKYKRVGKLFTQPFRRKRVESFRYFLQLIVYINTNPEKHQLIDNSANYKWCSLMAMFGNSYNWILKDEVFEAFGTEEIFLDQILEYRLKNHFEERFYKKCVIEE